MKEKVKSKVRPSFKHNSQNSLYGDFVIPAGKSIIIK